MSSEDEPAFDPSAVIAAVSTFLLGAAPSLTRADVAELSGVTPEVARERWRALGFPEVADGVVAFTHADVEALRLTQSLIDLGVVRPESEQAFIRTTGRTFARLAEWQARAMLASVIDTSTEDEPSLKVLDEIVPIGERVQAYVWRRHLVGAASRLLLKESTDTSGTPMCVGFADIVGYTTRSRSMSTGELAAMVDRFEEVATGLITDHHGQVVKTIGDEVLFVTDLPKDAALLALELLEEHLHDDMFPKVRVGLAHGKVLSRLGDVFGPVVNVASRLTSVAKPGRAVIDRAMADQLREDPELRIRRMRRTAVKGYDHLEPWSLKKPRESDDPRPTPRTAIVEAFEDATTQVDDATRIARAALGTAIERPRRERHGATKRSTSGNKTDKPEKAPDPKPGTAADESSGVDVELS